jgi:lysozyme family protein
MTAANFPAALQFTLSQEGGWSDDPNDPGGATERGITLQTYRWWHNNPHLQPTDLRGMSDSECENIYHTMFWDAVHGDDLPAGIDLATFDWAVNAGVGRAARALQFVVGTMQDGAIGPLTLAAAAGADANRTVTLLCGNRIAYYQSLDKPEFIDGWTNRASACEAAALALIAP